MIFLLGMIVIAVIVAPLVLAVIAMSRVRAVQRTNEKILARLASAEAQIGQLKQAGAAPVSGESATGAAQASPVKPASVAPRDRPATDQPEIRPVTTPARPPVQETAPQPTPEEPLKSLRKGENVEEALTSKWLVWLGAPLFALGGLFFVRYAVDLGLLTPWVRIIIGTVVGGALAVGGEWLRRRPLQRAIAAIRPNHVPPALTAAGLFVAFASIYAGYALHDLFPPVIAFALLALVSLAGVGLSLLQGRFVATLGVLAAFLTPGLIDSPDPSGWALFTYLAFVGAACLLVVRYERWWWLAAATVVAMVVWPLLWLLLQSGTDPVALSIYLLVASGLFLLLPVARAESPISTPGPWLRHLPGGPSLLPLLGFAGTLVLQTFHTIAEGLSPQSILPFGLMAVAALWFARRYEAYGIAAVGAAVAALAAVTFWPVASGESSGFVLAAPGLAPPSLFEGAALPLILTSIGFAVFFALAGFLAHRNARFPALWAGLSAVTPIAVLAIVYWRFSGGGAVAGWTIPALGVAAAALLAASVVSRGSDERAVETVLAIYALAVAAAIILGLTMALRESWLTVALSALPLATAWIAGRTGVSALRVFSVAVTAFVLLRLLAFPVVFDYPALADHFGAVLYGYGLPALLLLAASIILLRQGEALSFRLHFAASLIAGVLFATLQLRIGLSGSTGAPYNALAEISLQSILWCATGLILLWQFPDPRERILRGLSAIFLGIGFLQVVVLHILMVNPLFTPRVQIDAAVVNVLLLAFGVPAVLTLIMRRLALREGWPVIALAALVLSIVLVFANLTLEVRNLFTDSLVLASGTSTAELYTYSAVWTLFAFALLGLGLWRDNQALRFAGLGILALTLVKLFLVDMSELDGLYRVAAFIGLGAALVATGYVYQRVMIARGPPGLSED